MTPSSTWKVVFLILVVTSQQNPEATFSKPVIQHPDKPTLLFQDMGHYHVVESYIHFRIPVPFKNFLDGINTRISHIIQEKNQAEHAINTSGFRPIIHTIFDQGIKRFNALESKFLNLLDNLPQSKISNKRFLDILGTFLGGAALSMATYNNYKISEINKDIVNLQKEHNLLVDISQVHNEHLKELDSQLSQVNKFWREYFTVSPATMQEMISHFYLEMYDKFLTLSDTVTQAINGKLSTLILTPEVTSKIVLKLKEMAKNLNAEIPIKENIDLFHQDVSYLYDSKNFNFILLLHIPVIPQHLIFKIQRYEPFPFLYANDLVIPHVQEDILAINYVNDKYLKNSAQKTKYFTLNQDELNMCRKIGDNFYCKGRGVYTTNKNSLCLGALHEGSIKDISNRCTLKRSANEERVAQVNSQAWSVYLPSPMRTFAHCETSFENVQLENFNLIQLPPGCSMELRDHIIMANRNEPTETNSLVLMNWNLNLTETWPSLSEDFKNQLDQNDKKIQDLDRNLTSLHEKLNTAYITSGMETHHIGAAWSGLIAIVIIAILFGVYLVIRKIKQRPIQTGPPMDPNYMVPSGPPGPFYHLSQQLSKLSTCCSETEPAFPVNKPAPHPDMPQQSITIPVV